MHYTIVKSTVTSLLSCAAFALLKANILKAKSLCSSYKMQVYSAFPTKIYMTPGEKKEKRKCTSRRYRCCTQNVYFGKQLSMLKKAGNSVKHCQIFPHFFLHSSLLLSVTKDTLGYSVKLHQ